MYFGKIATVVASLAIALVTASDVEAAEAACVDAYLSCINVASQEYGAFWRTAKEFECGIDYYACMRKKVAGV